MSSAEKTILWFEDNSAVITLFKLEWAEKYEDVNIVHYENTEEGFLYLLHNKVDLIISHMAMPQPGGKLEMEGIPLLEAAKSIFPGLPFIIYTALSGQDKMFKDVKPDYCLVKSFNQDHLYSAVKQVLTPIKRLSVKDALRAYAKMINMFDVSALEPLLAEDFHYASQSVFHEIESKQEYMEYIVPKLQTIKHSDTPVWAEMAALEQVYPGGPCVVVAQWGRENLVATVLSTVENGEIKRIDMCIVPSPYSAKRTGEYPV